MSPVPLSPVTKVSSPHPLRTASQESSDGIRKRVCKACDRCRLKKSKCDGAHPCSRCKSDNAICVFGERKKSHDKVYPKGYVEMLEQQQGQLVSGLQEMYRRLTAANAWDAPALSESNGHPLTHDILASLNLLDTKHDGSGEMDGFEEDCQRLQSKLLAEGAGYVRRRGSFSSDSENSQHSHSQSAQHPSPPTPKPAAAFGENFNSFGSTSPPSLSHSPASQRKRSFPTPSPLQQSSPLSNDPQFYQAEWAVPDMSTPEQLMRSKFAMQTPEVQPSLSAMENTMPDNQFDVPPTFYDGSNGFNGLPVNSYSQQLSMPGMQQDFGLGLDPMDLFVQVQT